MSPPVISSALSRTSQFALKQALSTAGRRLSTTRVVGESGRGLVRATLSGDGRIVDLHVDSAIGKEGPKAISELVACAVNRAHDQLREETRKQMIQSLPPNVDPAMYRINLQMGLFKTICCTPVGLYLTTVLGITYINIIGARHDLKVWRMMQRAAAARKQASTKVTKSKEIPSSKKDN